MKTLLVAAAGALLLAGSAAQATTSSVQQFAGRAEAQALVRLNAAGVDLNGHSVAVRATVDGDGHLNGVRVVRSSGSRDTDAAIEAALKKLPVADAPTALIGGAITFTLGDVASEQAAAR